jgi:transposase InsO family protein
LGWVEVAQAGSVKRERKRIGLPERFGPVPKKIVSDRGTQFMSRFWEKLHEVVDTKLNLSSAYHPQTDGQTERVNQILEDMLRACALKDKKS